MLPRAQWRRGTRGWCEGITERRRTACAFSASTPLAMGSSSGSGAVCMWTPTVSVVNPARARPRMTTPELNAKRMGGARVIRREDETKGRGRLADLINRLWTRSVRSSSKEGHGEASYEFPTAFSLIICAPRMLLSCLTTWYLRVASHQFIGIVRRFCVGRHGHRLEGEWVRLARVAGACGRTVQ